jgi:formamidopyrimidine-DNA glycosylase
MKGLMMPELPEVETICLAFREGWEDHASLIRRDINQVWVGWNKTIAAPTIEEFTQKITNQKIHEISRRGKFLIFRLTQHHLLFHLRMSGDLILRRNDGNHLIHDRLVLEFTDGDELAFNDPRKFGRVWLVNDVQEVTGGLGPEPFDPTLNGNKFFEMLQKNRRQLKPLLLDQSFLAGLGNIYSDEALFLARLHPLTLSNQVSTVQAENLLSAIRSVLQKGIHHHGASIDWVYRGGDFQNYFRVYQRNGEACRVCGTPIEKFFLGQRGTHFCPSCQVR